MTEAQTIKKETQPTISRITIKKAFEEDYTTTEAYKSLRTNIQFSGDDIKTIAITSCLPNEGKSTVSMGIAQSLAQINKRVLLIDADMRKSNMVEKYVVQIGITGLSEYLTNQADLYESLYATQHQNLFVMFCGYNPPNPVELLESNKFKNFLENSKKSFDYIIIDTPPLGVVIDAAVIANYCDSAIIVIAAKKIKVSLARNVKAQLEKCKCRILGAVLNQVEHRSNQYYNKYYKGYYKHYCKEDVKKGKRR